MSFMTIRELNSNVSRAITRVEAGETLDITRHGKVVAELRPKAIVRDAKWHANFAEMLALLDKGAELGGGSLTEDDKYGDADL